MGMTQMSTETHAMGRICSVRTGNVKADQRTLRQMMQANKPRKAGK